MDQADHRRELVLQSELDRSIAEGETGFFKGREDAEGLVQVQDQTEGHGVVVHLVDAADGV